MRTTLVLVATLLLTSCASAPSEQQFQNRPAMPAETDKALIFFYRESNNLGCIADLTLTDSQSDIGTLHNGSYLAVYVSPGPHTFRPAMTIVLQKYATAYTADFEAGQTYYLRAQIFEVPEADFMNHHGSGLRIDEVPAPVALKQMADLVLAGEDNGYLLRCLFLT